MGYENNGISKSDNSSLNPNISQLPPPSAVIQNGGPPATEASAAVTTSPGMATNANIFHAFVYVMYYYLVPKERHDLKKTRLENSILNWINSIFSKA